MKADVNARDAYNYTPLHSLFSSKKPDEHVAKLLLFHKANPNLPNIQGLLPNNINQTLNNILTNSMKIEGGLIGKRKDKKIFNF